MYKRLFTILCITITTLFVSCESDDGGEDGLRGIISADIEGSPIRFQSDPNLTLTQSSPTIDGTLADFYIIGIDASGRILRLGMEGNYFEGIGTYDIKQTSNGNSPDIAYSQTENYWNAGGEGNNNTVVGKVTVESISSDNKKMIGSFYVTATNDDDGSTLEITNGYFEIEIVNN